MVYSIQIHKKHYFSDHIQLTVQQPSFFASFLFSIPSSILSYFFFKFPSIDLFKKQSLPFVDAFKTLGHNSESIQSSPHLSYIVYFRGYFSFLTPSFASSQDYKSFHSIFTNFLIFIQTLYFAVGSLP